MIYKQNVFSNILDIQTGFKHNDIYEYTLDNGS